MFVIRLRWPNAQSVVNGLMSIFTKHAYVPNTKLTDKGTTFTAKIVKRTLDQAGISLKHATIIHAQILGMIERTDLKLMTFLKNNISANQAQWDLYMSNAIIAHNTTSHVSLKCAPTEIFHGRTPHIALDLKFENPIRVANQATDVSKVLDEVNKKYTQNVHNILTAYYEFKTFYDRKTSSQPLKVNEFVLFFIPHYDDRSSKQHFKSFDWQGPYKVMNALSKSNYII